jgi:hypothetical protein
MSREFEAIMAAFDLLEHKATGDFPGADYDRWKTASDREGEDHDGAHRCSPCIDGEHAKCWNSWAYDRCLCAMRGHNAAD